MSEECRCTAIAPLCAWCKKDAEIARLRAFVRAADDFAERLDRMGIYVFCEESRRYAKAREAVGPCS